MQPMLVTGGTGTLGRPLVDLLARAGQPVRVRSRRVDVAGTGRLLDAARRAGSPHLVFISIVGVDRVPFRYYRAKLEAERLVEGSGLPWTIQRTTQFHDLLHRALGTLARSPVLLLPRGLRFEPVDTREVAERPGATARGFRAGGHLCPEHPDGMRTWAEFLAARYQKGR